MPRGITNHGHLRWQERKDAEAAAAERAVMAKVRHRVLSLEGQRFIAYDADSLLEVTNYHGRAICGERPTSGPSVVSDL